jgi:hypothetical protein
MWACRLHTAVAATNSQVKELLVLHILDRPCTDCNACLGTASSAFFKGEDPKKNFFERCLSFFNQNKMK